MKKKIIIGITTVGLLLGGTTIAASSMSKQEQPIVKVEDSAKLDVSVEKENFISVSDAKEIALAEYNGQIESIELEYEHGYAYYEVEFEDGDGDIEIYIDAKTGEVLKVEVDDDFDNKSSRKDVMSIEEAKEIAVNKLGGKVIEIELDEDDGRYEYEIELKIENGEAEITIDAVSGEILELEID